MNQNLSNRINQSAYQSLKEENQTDKESSRKFVFKVYIFCLIIMKKTAATGLKHIEKKFFIY